MVIYCLHKSEGFALTATSFLDTEAHGVFATRVPRRPNHIGFSVVRLLGREENILVIGDVDILDKTPVLDIKPYVPLFDAYPNERSVPAGLKEKSAKSLRQDNQMSDS